VTAVREKDQRNARVTWAAVPGATGYNLRWGVRPDRLTLTYQLFADEAVKAGKGSLALRSLNVGVGYHVVVEAFNETGVSGLSKVVAVR
jgi:xylan 1,4-beta-xylosidase